MLLALLCVGIFLVQLDVTVVNVALPTIRTGLDTSASGQQWVVSGYMIALAGLLLVCGALGDRIGHRRTVLAGLTVFGCASLVCGIAPNIELLIAARALQGVGAALLLPGTLAVITDQYVDSAARARAVGIWAGAGALALVAGPILGGVLVSGFGWRAVFLINLPIIVLVLPMAWRMVPRRRTARSEAHMRLRIGPAFVGANVVSGLMNLVGLGTLLALTLYLQEHLDQSALRSGLELLPVLLPLAVLGPVSGRITARYGSRLPMSFGLALGAIGSFCLLVVHPDSRYAAVIPVEVCLGIGMGLLTAAVVHAAIAALPPDRAGLAGGVNNTARQAVGAAGVALYSAVLSHSATFTAGLHTLAWVGGVLWLVALGITWLTVD
ncbi:DHA2 family methylenomycin A resistance protein-like MFS transporter [Kribbella rubisoli]|uniref:DHA2 family methylenomycin A resistance protein-like MFS transporter n=1 Tax=Kribbella rubisoli TaxID=3075929 RepID=A0A4V2FZ50_9ACTN|nr:MFS transporter [Kribbella rubisoli]RZU20096.1 DHA2 family methylenomycin A resistance protein-like MFS transporter [Kribbella rubisoli]